MNYRSPSCFVLFARAWFFLLKQWSKSFSRVTIASCFSSLTDRWVSGGRKRNPKSFTASKVALSSFSRTDFNIPLERAREVKCFRLCIWLGETKTQGHIRASGKSSYSFSLSLSLSVEWRMTQKMYAHPPDRRIFFLPSSVGGTMLIMITSPEYLFLSSCDYADECGSPGDKAVGTRPYFTLPA